MAKPIKTPCKWEITDPMMSPEHKISRPAHYARAGVEPIDLIMAQGLEAEQANVVKYVCRYKHKNGTEDLKKALQYLIWLYTKEIAKDHDIDGWYVNMKMPGTKTRLPDFSIELFNMIDRNFEYDRKRQLEESTYQESRFIPEAVFDSAYSDSPAVSGGGY